MRRDGRHVGHRRIEPPGTGVAVAEELLVEARLAHARATLRRVHEAVLTKIHTDVADRPAAQAEEDQVARLQVRARYRRRLRILLGAAVRGVA
jgi:hypothetical protein